MELQIKARCKIEMQFHAHRHRCVLVDVMLLAIEDLNNVAEVIIAISSTTSNDHGTSITTTCFYKWIGPWNLEIAHLNILDVFNIVDQVLMFNLVAVNDEGCVYLQDPV